MLPDVRRQTVSPRSSRVLLPLIGRVVPHMGLNAPPLVALLHDVEVGAGVRGTHGRSVLRRRPRDGVVAVDEGEGGVSTEIERATVAEEQAASTDENADPIARNLLNRFRIAQAIYLILPIALICLSLMLYFAFIERWMYLRLAPMLAIEKIVRNLYRRGRPLVGARTEAETAYEFKQKLIGRIETVRKSAILPKLLSGAQNDIEYLTELYQSTLFRQSNVQKQDSKKALQTWKRLRLHLWIARANIYFVNVILGGLKNSYQQLRRSLRRSKASSRAGL